MRDYTIEDDVAWNECIEKCVARRGRDVRNSRTDGSCHAGTRS